MKNNLFAAGTIAGDDGAAEQPPDNGEGEAQAPHRVPVKPVKIEGCTNRVAMSRSDEENDPFAISSFGALSIAISVHMHNPIRFPLHEDY